MSRGRPVDQPAAGGDRRQALLARLDDDTRTHLEAWMAQTGIELWYADWEERGNTLARVIAVYAWRAGGARKLIMKVCPPKGDVLREPGRHREALEAAPEFARRRLVEQPYPPIHLGGNGWIMFQGIAGDGLDRCRSLAKVMEDPDALGKVAPVCGAVAAAVLGEWNPPEKVELREATASAFLRSLLGSRIEPGGPVHRWASRHPGLLSGGQLWSQPGGGDPLRNPFALVLNPEVGGTATVPFLVGRCHGDLHPGNVVLTVAPELDAGNCRLIDLSRYRPAAELVNDPMHFLLTTVAAYLGDVDSRRQRDALAALLVDPTGSPQSFVPAGLCEIVKAVERAGLAWAARRDLPEEWRTQRLLALVGWALVLTGRDLPGRDQDWFYTLAARATAAYLDSLGKLAWTPRSAVRRAAEPVITVPVTPFVPLATRHLNVPARPARFVGREAELAELRALTGGGGPAVVVVVHGAPGTGKTQLAAEFAHQVGDRYTHVAWFDAEEPGLLREQFSTLAQALGHDAPADVPAVLRALFDALGRHGRWLFVFDGVDDPAAVRSYLPGNNATDVLITSCGGDWSPVGEVVELGAFSRAESTALVERRLPGLHAGEAGRLAAALDDLPLALDQATSFLEGAATLTVAGYLERLAAEAGRAERAARGHAAGDGGAAGSAQRASLVAAWRVALDFLADQAPPALALVEACSVAGAAPVPDTVVSDGLPELPAALAALGGDPVRLDEAMRLARRTGLLQREGSGFRLPRLLRAYLRDGMGSRRSGALRSHLRRALAAVRRGAPEDPANWDRYRLLLPHVLALDLAADDQAACHELLLDAVHFLIVRGDARGALDLASRAVVAWSNRYGPDAEPTLGGLNRQAQAHYWLGAYDKAAALDETVYRRRLATLGPDHPATLTAGYSLAVDLTAASGLMAGGADGDPVTRLHEDVLARRRSVLPPEHPDLLRSIHSLAHRLRTMGGRANLERARALASETYAAMRRTRGADHPDTLSAAHDLALALRTAGERARARELNEDTLQRRRALLGERHPSTLRSTLTCAHDLRLGGDRGRARELAEVAYDGLRLALGDDHPDTLRAAYWLGGDLRATGETARAMTLNEDTYQRLRRVLGDDHLDTLRAASSYAADLRLAGDAELARRLERGTADRLRRLLPAAGGRPG